MILHAKILPTVFRLAPDLRKQVGRIFARMQEYRQRSSHRHSCCLCRLLPPPNRLPTSSRALAVTSSRTLTSSVAPRAPVMRTSAPALLRVSTLLMLPDRSGAVTVTHPVQRTAARGRANQSCRCPLARGASLFVARSLTRTGRGPAAVGPYPLLTGVRPPCCMEGKMKFTLSQFPTSNFFLRSNQAHDI